MRCCTDKGMNFMTFTISKNLIAISHSTDRETSVAAVSKIAERVVEGERGEKEEREG